MKYLLIFIFAFTLVFAGDNKVVKTSELELFLFKIGFESLLKDVDLTKDKSNLNEEQLKKLSKKVEYIMNEIKKDKIIIKEDSFSSSNTKNNISNKEIILLKKQIKDLKTQVDNLKSKSLETHKDNKINTINKSAFINIKSADLKEEPYHSSQTLEILKRGQTIQIEYCDDFQWCKVSGKNAFIPKYLIKFNK